MPQVRDAAWDRIHRLQDAQAFTSLNQRSLVVRALVKAHPWGVSVGGASTLEGCDIHDYHHIHYRHNPKARSMMLNIPSFMGGNNTGENDTCMSTGLPTKSVFHVSLSQMSHR